jgi:polar amino acid transport system permease protein
VELQRLVFSFFNAEVAARYWPDILYGMWVTAYLGAAVIAAGLVAGLGLAMLRSFHFRPASFAIVVFADAFRALPPLVVIIVLFFAFPYVGLAVGAFTATCRAVAGAAAFAEDLLGRHPLDARPDRGGALGRHVAPADARVRDHPAGGAAHHPPLTNRMIAITKGPRSAQWWRCTRSSTTPRRERAKPATRRRSPSAPRPTW